MDGIGFLLGHFRTSSCKVASDFDADWNKFAGNMIVCRSSDD